ncbi:hypothetical protein A1Q_4028 [Vibrio campbellii HY01]|nr:hypothetical protein A1Q_4028 [Vibrio campbellii HY01]
MPTISNYPLNIIYDKDFDLSMIGDNHAFQLVMSAFVSVVNVQALT